MKAWLAGLLGKRSAGPRIASVRDAWRSVPPQSIDRWDHYLDAYEQWFPPFRGRDLRLLEIGVQRGGSLRMWRNYFGPRCSVVGVDIDPNCRAAAGEGIAVAIGDQSDPAFLAGLLAAHGPFDIVIDDGSHVGQHQIASFEALFPSTRHIYAIEDTHTAYWQGFTTADDPRDIVAYAKDRIDDLHAYFRNAKGTAAFDDGAVPARRVYDTAFRDQATSICFYDSLIVFRKGANPPPKRLRVKAA